jgi:hypothetical protein
MQPNDYSGRVKLNAVLGKSSPVIPGTRGAMKESDICPQIGVNFISAIPQESVHQSLDDESSVTDAGTIGVKAIPAFGSLSGTFADVSAGSSAPFVSS